MTLGARAVGGTSPVRVGAATPDPLAPGAGVGRPRRGRAALPLLLLAATLQPGEREVACAALAIVDVRDGAILGGWPLRPGEPLAYAYTHTAEGLPSEEVLGLGPDGELHLVASRSPQHGGGHVPRAPLRVSGERPGWQEARFASRRPLTPFAMFTGDRDLGDPRLLWRGRDVALARLRPRRHVEWRVERRCR